MFRRLKAWRLPMLGIAGQESDVLDSKALATWQRVVPQLELHNLKGGHLIPLEQPQYCADLITQFILRNVR